MSTDAAPKPPDLQELVARFGTYSAITPEAWAEWDRLNAEYQAARRRGLAAERKPGAGQDAEIPDGAGAR